jgi:glycosyltransferase involved in cell wall biosynthesis
MELRNCKMKILYFIQLPPPVHGVSITNKQIYSSKLINENLEKLLLEIKFSDHIHQLRVVTIQKFIRFFHICLSMVWILIKEKPDLVYFSFMPVGRGLYRDAVFALILKLFRRKIVFHIHNRGIIKYADKKLFNLLYRQIFNNTIIIHVSERLIEEEFKYLGLNTTRFFVVPNAVEARKPEIIRKADRNTINLLYLSNLFEEKGIFDLLEIFENLLLDNQNINLFIVGAPTGNIERDIKKQISEKPLLNDRVVYYGPLYGSAKHQILADSDVFVFPSYFAEECFPLSILDAMAAGLPIVSSNIGAISEIIKDSVNGFIVNSRDLFAFKKQLQLLIVDMDLRKRMGEESIRLFNKYYTLPIFEQRIKKILNQI